MRPLASERICSILCKVNFHRLKYVLVSRSSVGIAPAVVKGGRFGCVVKCAGVGFPIGRITTQVDIACVGVVVGTEDSGIGKKSFRRHVVPSTTTSNIGIARIVAVRTKGSGSRMLRCGHGVMSRRLLNVDVQ
jgi:hypothetical protein